MEVAPTANKDMLSIGNNLLDLSRTGREVLMVRRKWMRGTRVYVKSG